MVNLDWSLAVTENILTVEALVELPHKLLLGRHLLPDTPLQPGERREEKVWKCLTRGRLLARRERQVLLEVARQVEGRLEDRVGGRVCGQAGQGRGWVRERGQELEEGKKG